MADQEEVKQQIEEIHAKSMEILRVFKQFCEENHLLFYFCGGCCIGTVRHKGFIPWDDDIDVFMPRKDYEKLAVLWPQKMKDTQYVYCRNNEKMYLRSLLSAISDENTTFIKERQADLDINHGNRLEILPLDGCPDNKIKRKLQLFMGLTYQIYMNQEPPTSKGAFLEFIGKCMLAVAPTWKMRYKIGKFAEKQMSKYPIEACSKITELCARWQYMVNEYPASAFQSAVYKEFEGELMPIPVGYDDYLKMAFGDYMTLPPEDKQYPKHDALFLDLKHSYKDYKGKYYPVK